MITSKRQRDLIKGACQDILDKATLTNRGLTTKETQDFDDFMIDIKEWDERQKGTLSPGAYRGADGFAYTGNGSGHEARFTTNGPEVYSDPRTRTPRARPTSGTCSTPSVATLTLPTVCGRTTSMWARSRGRWAAMSPVQLASSLHRSG